MTQSLKYVTYFLKYYTDTIAQGRCDVDSREFLFDFIGKAWFRRAKLSCDSS